MDGAISIHRDADRATARQDKRSRAMDFDVRMKIVPNTLGDSAVHLQNTANTLVACAKQSAPVTAGSEEASLTCRRLHRPQND
jgi:hypothetical protein